MKRRTLTTEAERNSVHEGTICMDAFGKAWTKTGAGWASVDGEFSSVSLELLVLHEVLDWDALRPARDDIARRINDVDKTIGWETAPEASGFYATAVLSAGYRKVEA